MIHFFRYFQKLHSKIMGRSMKARDTVATSAVLTERSDEYLREIGIGNYGDSEVTGEAHLLRLLSAKLAKKKCIIFDVGANVGESGEYAHIMRDHFPEAEIYAFEPNPKAYKELCSATAGDTHQHNELVGLGHETGKTRHYSYSGNEGLELAGTNKVIFKDVFKSKKKIISYNVNITTLDQYCRSKNISKIHFLKIDVEGSEHLVLQGAKSMISKKQIDYIQFEFNIHNIYSRIFMKDFYQLLQGYKLYRLSSSQLIPLGDYSTQFEVFRYQNILACKPSLEL